MRASMTWTREVAPWAALAALALVYVAFEMTSTHQVAWDELEFFLATRWVA